MSTKMHKNTTEEVRKEELSSLFDADTPQLKDLNLSSNFLFGEVMWDEQTSKDVLEIILGKEIDKVVIVNKEQHMDIDQKHKGVRLDVFLKDGKGTIYNIEIQVKNKYNIRRRSRHYQGVIDTKILPAGEINYNKLNDCYVIFICDFDLFKRGKYCYTFEERCLEVPDLALEDGTRKIFLNMKGKNENEANPELVEFLKYVKKTEDADFESERMKRLAQRVKHVKESREVEARYMTMLIHDKEIEMDAREEGIKEGKKEGIKEGRNAANIENAQRMLLKDIQISLIMEITDLPKEKVEKIKQEMIKKGELKEK